MLHIYRMIPTFSSVSRPRGARIEGLRRFLMMMIERYKYGWWSFPSIKYEWFIARDNTCKYKTPTNVISFVKIKMRNYIPRNKYFTAYTTEPFENCNVKLCLLYFTNYLVPHVHMCTSHDSILKQENNWLPFFLLICLLRWLSLTHHNKNCKATSPYYCVPHTQRPTVIHFCKTIFNWELKHMFGVMNPNMIPYKNVWRKAKTIQERNT